MIDEIKIAHNVINNQDFLQASEKVKTAKERINLMLFEEVIRQVSGAISAVTNSGQWVMQIGRTPVCCSFLSVSKRFICLFFGYCF